MRTIFSVDTFGEIDPVTANERMIVQVLRSPFNVVGANVARVFNLSSSQLPAWGGPNAVRERGRKVRDSLLSHEGISKVLARLSETPLGEIQPLYVKLSGGDAELINWETLCDTNDEFVALDQRWPIGRISDPMSGQSRPPAEWQLPVRLMVVVSALGIKGQKREWEMFRDAVLKARADGIDIQLKVLVGEPVLRATIDQAIAGGLAGVEVSHIDSTPSRVVQEISGWSPHILHFFCHGLVDAKEQSLELATALDYADSTIDAGSVKIRTKQLIDLSLSLANPWLLTLNCCSSGRAAQDLQSMAHQIVSAGFPAAVAMLEPVDANDAHEFTRAFYRSLFANLGQMAAMLKTSARVSFEWLYAMHDARTALRDLHEGDAQNSREWTLPILCVRGTEPFSFELPRAAAGGADTEFKMRARVVAEWLHSVGAQNSSEQQRQAIMEQVLDGVPKTFWPSLDGTFHNA